MKILVLLITLFMFFSNTAFAGYVKNEQGIMIWNNIKDSEISVVSWSGTIVDGYAEGDGTLKFYLRKNNKLFEIYQGSLKKGKMHGKGIYNAVLFGLSYEGDFVDGKFHGKGTLIFTNGIKYEGSFVDGRFHGKGALTFANNNKYEGAFVDGKMHGKGSITFVNSDKYEGDFTDNSQTGTGTYTWNDGSKYKGEFLRGILHGLGILYDKDGKIIQQGRWELGAFLD